MVRTILAFFGYVKVPKEAVQMSMLLEDDFKDLIELFLDIGEDAPPSYKEVAKRLKNRKRAMEVMTEFLRSGRLLS